MVDWVALCQAAKKGLRHSPYVTCFPSASAVCICYQSAPAESLGVLNINPLTTPQFLDFLPVSLFSFYPPPCVCVTCHMDVIADKRMLIHVESMAIQHARTHTRTRCACAHAWQQTHINKTPTYSYVSGSVPLSCSHVSVCVYSFSKGGGLEEYCFSCSRQALAVMYRTAHFLLLSHKHAASWGRADG